MEVGQSRAALCTYVITFGVLLFASQATCQSLRYTREAAVEVTRQFKSYYAKSIVTHAYNSEQFRAQLWTKVEDNPDALKLHWQQTFEPTETGRIVFDMKEDLWVNSSYLPGILNKNVPGPLHGIFHTKNHVRLSINETSHLWDKLNPGQTVTTKFDDLTMPYKLPIYFCEIQGCPGDYDFGEIYTTEPAPTTTTPKATYPTDDPTPQPVIQVKDDDDWLVSRNATILLLVWNAILTVLIFIIVIVLTSICNDMEKTKKERRRYDVYDTDRSRQRSTMTSVLSSQIGSDVGGHENPLSRYESPAGMSEILEEEDDTPYTTPTLSHRPFPGTAAKF